MDERNVGTRTLTRDALIYGKVEHSCFDPDVVRVIIGFRPQKKPIDMFFSFSAFGHVFGNDFFFVIAELIHLDGNCWIVPFVKDAGILFNFACSW
jgi:hypothetical protein